MRTWTILGAGLLASLLTFSCSSDTGSTDGGNGDSGGGDSGGKDSSADTGTPSDSGSPDSGPSDSGSMGDVPFTLNGCTDNDFVDRSAANANRTITWDFSVQPKCILVAKGQTVTWQGTLTAHPLAPFNGDMPNPIMNTSTGTSVMFTFPNAGNYGFHCNIHASMQGVVRVKP